MIPDDTDLLTGYVQIAAFLGWKSRTVRHRAANGELPTFKIGRTPCATKSALRSWLAKQMTQAEGATKRAS